MFAGTSYHWLLLVKTLFPTATIKMMPLRAKNWNQVYTSMTFLISIFTLGNIYSTCASGAKQMTETNNSNQT